MLRDLLCGGLIRISARAILPFPPDIILPWQMYQSSMPKMTVARWVEKARGQGSHSHGGKVGNLYN